MSQDPRHHLGQEGERLAERHLERLGYRILDRNFRTRAGELDLVAANESTLIFCEVKTRRALGPSRTPFEAIHHRKQERIRKLASAWLRENPHRPHADELRFDAIAIVFDPQGRLQSLEHLEAAF